MLLRTTQTLNSWRRRKKKQARHFVGIPTVAYEDMKNSRGTGCAPWEGSLAGPSIGPGYAR